MPKSLLFIIIGLVLIGGIGYFAMNAVKNPSIQYNGVSVNPNSDGSITYSNDEGTATIGASSLPDNWPSDAPSYPNSKIVYSGSSNPQTGAEGAAVSFTTSDSINDVVEFYKRELASNGWSIESTANVGTNTVLTAKKDTRTFGAYIGDMNNGQVTVTVGIELPQE